MNELMVKILRLCQEINDNGIGHASFIYSEGTKGIYSVFVHQVDYDLIDGSGAIERLRVGHHLKEYSSEAERCIADLEWLIKEHSNV